MRKVDAIVAEIVYKDSLPKIEKCEEDRIRQGDYVFCDASRTGVQSFWGIYSEALGTVICLDGAGGEYIRGEKLYLGDTYNYWTITKRIPSNKIKLTIEEIK